MRISALFAFVLGIAIYFSPFVSRLAHPGVNQVVQLFIFAIVLWVVVRSLLRNAIPVSVLILAAYVAVFFLFSVFGRLNPTISESIISSLIFAKFFFVFLLARHVSADKLKGSIYLLACVHLVAFAITLVDPTVFTDLLREVGYARDESRFIGFLLNPNRSAALLSLIVIYLVLIERRFILPLLFFGLLVFTGSRSFILLTGVLVIYGLYAKKELPVQSLVPVLVLGILLFVASVPILDFADTWEKVKRTIDGEGLYIRAAMLFGGMQLAVEFFPFGSGGGKFGSSLSAGSMAYEILGIAHWPTVANMTGVFDSGLGSVVGEYGWFGLSVYIGFLYLLLRYSSRTPFPVGKSLVILISVLYMGIFRTVASDVFYSLYFLSLYVVFRDFVAAKSSYESRYMRLVSSSNVGKSDK